MQGNPKKVLTYTIVILFAVSALISPAPYVSAQSDSHVLNVPAQYATIQSAVDAANNGDTIMVSSGRYYETVTVNKSVSIIGQSTVSTTVYGLVEGYDPSSNGSPFYVTASNVLIANFTLKQGEEHKGAIRASGAQDVTIKGNIISQGYGYSGTAISVYNCTAFAILGNSIVEHGGCIDIQMSSNGEISTNTMVDLSYTILLRDSSNIKFKDNTISQCDDGLLITNAPNCILERNNVAVVGTGISLTQCAQSTLNSNNVADCWTGLSLSECSQTVLRNNVITNCTRNFGVFGYTLDDFNLDIDTSNTLNGKPVYYLTNQTNLIINPAKYPNAGYLALINCKNVTVQEMTLADNLYGLLLAHTTDSLITHNVFTNNGDTVYLLNQSDRNTITFNQIQQYSTGVRVYQSNGQTISGNNISGGSNAVWLEQTTGNTILGNTLNGNYEALHLVDTSNNSIYHNNFVSNTLSGAWGGEGDWNIHYPAGGNYLGSSGVDFYGGISQGELGSDGIFDEGLFYPLAAPVQLFEAGELNGVMVYIELESNSTITDIYIDAQTHTFSFTATGPSESTGFCRITIPNSILQTAWQNNYTILLNGDAQAPRNWTDSKNSYFYVSYPHPSSNISVPEFPTHVALLAVLAATLLVAFAAKKTLKIGEL